MPTVEFNRKAEADRFREEHPDAIAEADDRRLKAVELVDDVDQDVLERAEEGAVVGGGREVRATQAALSDDERDRLEARPGWNWQDHGAEAMWAKGTLQREGATEWMDFYESGEGWEGALENMRASAERSAATGAPTGQRVDRDPDAASAERMGDVATGRDRSCDHAEDVCRRGDPDACEFLIETCGFSEGEVDAILGVAEPDELEAVDVGEPAEAGDSPFTGIQQDALDRSWGGYQGAIAELEDDPDDREARRHATKAFRAINAIRADVGQEPLEPERLEELGGPLERGAEVDAEAAESGQGRETTQAPARGGPEPSLSKLPVAVAFLALILWFIAWASQQNE